MSKSSKTIAKFLNATNITCTCGHRLKVLDIIWSRKQFMILEILEDAYEAKDWPGYSLYDSQLHKVMFTTPDNRLENCLNLFNGLLPKECKMTAKEIKEICLNQAEQ